MKVTLPRNLYVEGVGKWKKGAGVDLPDSVFAHLPKDAKIVVPPKNTPLRKDGPTIEEYVKAGYPAEHYPPKGYAEKPSAGLDRFRLTGEVDLPKVADNKSPVAPKPGQDGEPGKAPVKDSDKAKTEGEAGNGDALKDKAKK